MVTKYPACDHIKRSQISREITEDVAEAIGRDYRTLPIFENGVFEYTTKRHYSLERNEYLKCKWSEYKKHIEEKVYSPFHFLNIRDYHFYNCKNRLMPSISIFNREDYRMKLRTGPGVDCRGQIPIPSDMIMKRGRQKPKPERKRLMSEEAKADPKLPTA